MNKELLMASSQVAFISLIDEIGKFLHFAGKSDKPISRNEILELVLCCSKREVDRQKVLDELFEYFPSTQQSNILCKDFLSNVIEQADLLAQGVSKQHNIELSDSDISKKRLDSLFQSIKINSSHCCSRDFGFPLKIMSASSIFPKLKEKIIPRDSKESKSEYQSLYFSLVDGLNQIPSSHKESWQLWLDHFDSLWQSITSLIPSYGTLDSDVSLYDHSRVRAAIATAMWRWHYENKTDSNELFLLQSQESWEEDKFLLVQGDFFGIQNFIFAEGGETNKKSAKLLRGRSFQVSLFSELAALKVLQKCALPSISQVINAAGKFLIIAPNTEFVRNAIQEAKKELNEWFIKNTYGEVGLGLAIKSVRCIDFLGENFESLMKSLFEELEITKLQRFDLTSDTPSVLNVDYPFGVCVVNNKLPASANLDGLSYISLDQIRIGECLVKKQRILIVDNAIESFNNDTNSLKLSIPIFGYQVIFTPEENVTGRFGEIAKIGKLFRAWNYDIPSSLDQAIWSGYAIRYINAYVPTFSDVYEYNSNKYAGVENEEVNLSSIKTFDFIACEDRELKSNKDNEYCGQVALGTLKGDVDNLGMIFQKGLSKPTFSKMTSLSRQMNLFFSLWLPVFCQENYVNTYTVFAGGDDFFLIGPWYSIQKLALEMNLYFADYVANNNEIHFSAGIVMTKLGMPVTHLGRLAEEALGKAKSRIPSSNDKQIEAQDMGKNAVNIFGKVLKWSDLQKLFNVETNISYLQNKYDISSSYLYSLIGLAEMSTRKELESTMWRSQFYYKTVRYVIDKQDKEVRDIALKDIIEAFGEKGIVSWKDKFTLPLFNYFYKHRN